MADKNDKKQELSWSHRVSIAGQGASSGAYTGVAYTLGMPVDIINLGMKAVGIKTSEEPVLGGAHIDRIMQSGLSTYYNKIAPAIVKGYKPAEITDGVDEKLAIGSTIAGALVGFGGTATAANALISGAGKGLAAGGTAQLIAEAPELYQMAKILAHKIADAINPFETTQHFAQAASGKIHYKDESPVMAQQPTPKHPSRELNM